ncbi:hypothetical protein F5Y04DRAFT_22727 [Hypomontagnella monticulosa]|nr:hypothetical protein F5Y04DRAFT_22727 [Hypomontagnella monticulosa]
MSKNQDFDLLKPVSTSPQRPRHQIKRSITELSSPIKLPRYHHLHHSQRKDRDNDDHAPLSASPMLHLPRGSLELPRSEGTTPSAHSDSNLRISMLNPAPDDTAQGMGPSVPRPPSLDQEEVLREQREKFALRITGLRKSLGDLNTFSTSTMGRLDDTYYAVLEKLSTLQSTIIGLKELAGMSQELNGKFEKESQALYSELEEQTDYFGQFDDQQKRIEELQGRIHTGRGKVEALSKRVDVVRERIEGWERADKEWQERTRKRLKIIWIITSVIVFSVILIVVGAQYVPSSEDLPKLGDSTPSIGNGESNMPEVVGNQSVSVAAMIDEVRDALNSRRDNGSAKDDVFRVFDEL